MATTDILQRCNEALVAVLDTREGVCDLTHQPEANVIPWRDHLEDLLTPDRDGLLAYHIVFARQTGESPGDFWRVVMQCTAVARSETVANALCEQVEQGFTCSALAALGTPLDARIVERTRQANAPETDTAVHLATIDVTLVVKR